MSLNLRKLTRSYRELVGSSEEKQRLVLVYVAAKVWISVRDKLYSG